MQEIQVQSLGWEDPLEKGMATHSSILAHGHGQEFLPMEIPWTEESGRLQSMGLQRVRQDLVTKQQTRLSSFTDSMTFLHEELLETV